VRWQQRARLDEDDHDRRSFNMPHVAVIDASGQVVGEWDGTTNLRAIDAALSSLP
jgi:hypothetical protein